MKLRVSEAALYTGLGNDTLRYYESLGIVKPYRDPDSGYRIYSDWDLHFLTDTKWYRGFDIPLADVTEIVRGDSLEDIIHKCERQEAALLKTIQRYREKLLALNRHLERIHRIQTNLGVFTHVNSPAIVYQRNQINPDGKFMECLQRWQSLFPFVNHTFLMTMDELQNLGGESEPYFGFSLLSDDALKYQIEPVSPAQYIPSCRCLYTIFQVKGPGAFIETFKREVLEPLKRQNYVIARGVWGNLIVRYHNGEDLYRVFEVWIPIHFD